MLRGAIELGSGRLHVPVGVDAERRDRVERRLWPQIACAEEIGWIDAGAGLSRQRATLLFSAKEAFYKAQYAITRAFLGFHAVRFIPEDDGFGIEVVQPPAGLADHGAYFRGSVMWTGDHVITALCIPA